MNFLPPSFASRDYERAEQHLPMKSLTNKESIAQVKADGSEDRRVGVQVVWAERR